MSNTIIAAACKGLNWPFQHKHPHLASRPESTGQTSHPLDDRKDYHTEYLEVEKEFR